MNKVHQIGAVCAGLIFAGSGVGTTLATPAGSVFGTILPASVSNLSCMLTVPANGSTSSLGFVVTGSTATFLIRAVGPSLTAFGIQNPAGAPVIHLFDSAGKEMFSTTVTSISSIALNWPATFASVGAFPLSGGSDAYEVLGLNPGAYTIQVSDSAGKGGMVLLELYQNPTAVPFGGIITPVTVTPSVQPARDSGSGVTRR